MGHRADREAEGLIFVLASWLSAKKGPGCDVDSAAALAVPVALRPGPSRGWQPRGRAARDMPKNHQSSRSKYSSRDLAKALMTVFYSISLLAHNATERVR